MLIINNTRVINRKDNFAFGKIACGEYADTMNVRLCDDYLSHTISDA